MLSEAELLKMLGISKAALANMRYQGLPCVYLSGRCRVYIDREVLGWAANRSKPRGTKKVLV